MGQAERPVATVPVAVRSGIGTVPSLDEPISTSPAALRDALRGSRGTSGSAGFPARARSSRELDPERFAALDHNPTALLAELSDDELAARRAPVASASTACLREFDAGASAAARGGSGARRTSASSVAYFSCEFGLDESLPDLLRRPRRARRRPPEVGVGSRRSARRPSGLFYREGYFRQQLDAQRLADRALPARTTRSGCRSRSRRCAPVSSSRTSPARSYRSASQVWRVAGRTRPAVPARHRRRRQSRLGAHDHRHALRRRPRAPPAPGARARHRRRARACAALGPRPDRLPHERRPLGVPPARAAARARRGRAAPTRRRAAAAPRVDRLHHAHARAGRQRDLRRRRSSSGTSGSSSTRCGFTWDEFVALGRVKADETGFGLTPFALRTSTYANGVSALHGEVSREMWHGLWPERSLDEVPIGSVTNGVHARTWISRRARRAARHRGGHGDARLRARVRARRRDRSGARSGTRREALIGFMRSRGLPALVRPRRADDRLRAPLRDLQARRPHLQRSRPAREAARRHRPSAPDRHGRQGAPGRRGRQGADPEGRRVCARARRRTAASSSSPTTR